MLLTSTLLPLGSCAPCRRSLLDSMTRSQTSASHPGSLRRTNTIPRSQCGVSWFFLEKKIAMGKRALGTFAAVKLLSNWPSVWKWGLV